MNRGDTLITYFKYLPTRKQCGGGERKKHLVTSPIIFFFDLGSAIRAAVSFSQNTTHQKQTNKQSPTGDFSRLPTKVWERTKIFLARKKWLFISWPTTVTAKTKTSRRNQKPHGKNKIPHGKTKNFTAKPNTSQQKQNSFGFAVGISSFAVRYLAFAVKYLFLPWGLWFCREGFGFAVRFSVLRWGILFLPWGFWFCRDSCVGHRSERLDYHFDLRARRQLSHLSLFGWWLQ